MCSTSKAKPQTSSESMKPAWVQQSQIDVGVFVSAVPHCNESVPLMPTLTYELVPVPEMLEAVLVDRFLRVMPVYHAGQRVRTQ